MAVDIFFKLGDKIKGESVNDGKDLLGGPLKDQMEIMSWNWALSQSGTTHSGTGGGGGKANVNDITITKYVDMASNDIITALCKGEHIPTALLTVRKAGGDKPVNYYGIEFEDIILSNYHISGSKDELDRMVESFSINFARFRITYTRQNEKGGESGKSTAGWNIPKGVVF